MRESVVTYFKGDKVIWSVILALTILSLLAVYSSTGTLAYRYQEGNTIYYFMRHFIFQMIGLGLIFLTHLINYRIYSKLSQLLLIVSIPLLLLTLVMGTSLNEASRWLTVPGLGITLQTSDLAKLSLIMYIARVLSTKQDEIDDFKEAFLPVFIPVALVCMLILPANFSTAAILFTTSMILMFIGRINAKYLFSLVGIGILALTIFIVVVMNMDTKSRVGTWKHRIEAFTSGEGGDNYQVEQAKIAVVTGGIFGKGPGNSSQRNFLPHPYSDFIYAIIIEEYGLVGGIVILALYLFLFFRAGLIVRRCSRTFPAFMAFGLSLMLVFQAMINMAVAVNLLPVTGQTLPLVSMGGSSVMFTSISLGVLLSVSRDLDENPDGSKEGADESDEEEDNEEEIEIEDEKA